MSNVNKEIVNKAKEALKELGHEVSTGHVYELLSKLAGYKSWNVAKAQSVAFAERIFPGAEPVVVARKGLKMFSVKIKCGDENSLEVKKYYTVSAESEEQAKEIVKEYIDFNDNMSRSEQSKYQFKFKETEMLVEDESNSTFQHENWMITAIDDQKYVSEVYEVPEKENIDSKIKNASTIGARLLKAIDSLGTSAAKK